ncbi:MAG: hypothetical protein QOH04_1018 [Sphingomonadales bacterium]|jgi:hypothetical protein|nr:hypothetical protein [Sphingomonadales bacterium]
MLTLGQEPIDAPPVESWRVTHGGTVVRVATNLPGVDALLRHALGAHAAVLPAPAGAGREGMWTIRVLASADYEARLAALGARPAGDGGAGGLANYWRSDFPAERLGGQEGVAAVRHSGGFEGVTVFEAVPKRVTYLFPATTTLFLPHLEHLVAHALRLEGWRRGFVDLHAAFVRYRNKGVALIGARRAGKTSLAMHLLSRGGELVGSDMAQIRVGPDGRIDAAAIPHMCRITRETIRDNGWLAAAIGASCDGNSDYLRGPLFSHGKYELYDPSLDRVFRRPVGIPAMRLDAILFPHFDVALARYEACETAPEDAVQRLVRSVRTDRPLADWLPFDLAGREQGEAELERRLLSREAAIRAYDFGFGREPSLDWESIDPLFDEM